MSRIHSRDTAPELVVRRFLWEKGFRYRTCMKSVFGHPDIVFRKYRTLIEIRGCFWHRHEGCSLASDPKSNLAFWNAKFERNVARDLEHEKYWHEHGWNVIVVWAAQEESGRDAGHHPAPSRDLWRFGKLPPVTRS